MAMSDIRPVDLVESGLLWLINKEVLHSRGFQLGRADDGSLWLMGDGTLPMVFDATQIDEADMLNRVKNTLQPAAMTLSGTATVIDEAEEAISEMGEFELKDVLSVTSGVLLGQMAGIYLVCNFMMGRSVPTHALPDISGPVSHLIIEQHPELKDVVPPERQRKDHVQLRLWLQDQEKYFGRRIKLVRTDGRQMKSQATLGVSDTELALREYVRQVTYPESEKMTASGGIRVTGVEEPR